MKIIFIKILTFITCSVIFTVANAEVFSSNLSKSHLRWNLYSHKDDLLIFNKNQSILIKSMKTDLIANIYKDIKKANKKNPYIKSIKLNGPDSIRNNSSIEITFTGSEVEVFSFYKARDNKYIIDFWKDSIDQEGEKLLSSKVKNIKSIPTTKTQITKINKTIKPPKLLKKPKIKKIVRVKKVNPYRDFRYGAALIWDYDAIAPTIKKPVDLTIKLPTFLFPIRDLKEIKTDADKHMQLTINLYRKDKWGLMYKSIKLYYKKFGNNKNWEFNEYLKVNAILKDNLLKADKSTQKMAINMLNDILLGTDNYEMRRAIYKYLSSFYLSGGDFIAILNLAKRFYVDSKKNFDFEESNLAAELILFGLAKLRRIEKVNSLLKEKTIVKLLPKQLLIAYQTYTYLSLNQGNEVIDLYNKHKNGFVGTIHNVILYNTAEAYFRQSDFKSAIKLYDQYLKHYSYHSDSANARLRIALSYDLLDKNTREIELLYKTAIDRAQSFDISYEAKLRYIGFRNLRKKSVNASDKEIRIFIETSTNAKVSKELLNLKRLVRLRLFIVDKKYSEALSYIKALPLKTMKRSFVRIFESEAGEVVNGLIHSFYQKSEYANVLKTWQVYQKKYLFKLAKDPTMNFIVGDSFIKLGLFDGFEKHIAKVKKHDLVVTQTYPIWFARKRNTNSSDHLFEELTIIKNLKLKNFINLDDKIKAAKIDEVKKHYYNGKVFCIQNNYNKCIKEFEAFLAKSKSHTILDLSDVASMFNLYTDALFEVGDIKRYLKMAEALLQDTSHLKKDHRLMNEVREKIFYNSIELIAAEETKRSSVLVENKIKTFFKEYKKTIYKDRLNYLLAVSLIKGKNNEKGMKILNDLILQKDVSEDIKELSRSELALQNIINQEV